jgi:hypothetical protein
MSIGANGAFQVSLIIAYLLSIMFFKHLEKKIKMTIIISLILITTVYVEFFNGIETFEDKEEFFLYHEKEKKHFWLLPQKTFKDNRGFINVFTPESKISAGPSAGFLITEIKIQADELFYLGIKNRKLGQLPISAWFKFGEKEDWSRVVAYSPLFNKRVQCSIRAFASCANVAG